MDTIIKLTDKLGNSVIAEAIIISVLVLIVFKLGVDILFNYRTKLLAALDETQQKHIKELKDMNAEKDKEKEDCVTMLKEMGERLGKVQREMAMLTKFVKEYACNNAPSCERRSPAEYETCQDCSEESCIDCPFLNGTPL